MSAPDGSPANMTAAAVGPARPVAAPDYSWMQDTIEIVTLVSSLYSVILGSLALCCNSLSFIVLSRKAFEKSNLSVYLRCLTVSDSITLIFVTIRYSSELFYGVVLMNNDVWCSMYFYLTNVSLYSSSWILVVVSVERVIAIVQPHSIHVICSRNKAKLAMGIVFGVWLAALCFYAIYHMDYFLQGSGNKTHHLHCILVLPSLMVIDLATWVDILFLALIPACTLIVCSCIIVIGLRMNKKKLTSTKGQQNKTLAADADKTDGEKEMDGGYQGKRSQAKGGSSSRESTMTRTVLAVNVCFVLFNFPYCIFIIIPAELISTDHYDWLYIQRVTNKILIMLMYTNNALNFAMYVLAGSKFRQELMAFFREIFGKLKKKISN